MLNKTSIEIFQLLGGFQTDLSDKGKNRGLVQHLILFPQVPGHTISSFWIKQQSIGHLKDHLNSCGLGRKKIVFSDKNGDHKHIRETLESHFPKLVEQNGAFQLLKSLSGGSGVRNLVPLMIPPGGYTVSNLKDQCKSSLIYIKPLQKRFDIN